MEGCTTYRSPLPDANVRVADLVEHVTQLRRGPSEHPTWPEEAREEYALTEALREGKATPELLQSVQGKITSLRQFKTWLGNRAIRATFTTPEQLHGKVLHALHEWRQRQPGLAPAPAKNDRPPANPATYLRSLLARNAFIDIRGLQVGAGKAYRFPIEDLFISLTTTGRPHAPDQAPGGKEGKRGSDERGMAASTVLPLHAALAHRLLVVVGDPGSGKTTFVRRVARSRLRAVPRRAPDPIPSSPPGSPPRKNAGARPAIPR